MEFLKDMSIFKAEFFFETLFYYLMYVMYRNKSTHKKNEAFTAIVLALRDLKENP